VKRLLVLREMPASQSTWTSLIFTELAKLNWRRPDSLRLPNGQLIGPGCVRSPGTDVSPNQSGGVRVSVNTCEAARFSR